MKRYGSKYNFDPAAESGGGEEEFAGAFVVSHSEFCLAGSDLQSEPYV